MKLWSRQLTLAVASGTAVMLIGIGVTSRRAAAQAGKAAPQTRPPAGEFFKNVNTSTLKGLSVDDFLGSMGVMAAALGFDCSDCHPRAGSDTVNWVIGTPRKVIARRMVEMVAVINRTNFRRSAGGHVLDLPSRPRFPTTGIHSWIICMVRLTTRRTMSSPKVLEALLPTRFLNKYILALGRAQRLARPHQLYRHGDSSRRIRTARRRRHVPDFRESPGSAHHSHHVQGTPGPRRQYPDLRWPRGLDQDAAVLTGSVRTDRKRAGRGQARRAIVLSGTDQADRH